MRWLFSAEEEMRLKIQWLLHNIAVMMKSNQILSALGLLLIVVVAFSFKSDNLPTVDETRRIVTALAGDEMLGRDASNAGYDRSSAFIESELKKSKIKPFYETYKDTFSVGEIKTHNVVGIIPASKKTDEYILIGAHLDHIGTKGGEQDTIFNGANDNASGVTAAVQIAQFLKQHKLKKNVIVALFGAEEKGLLGSKHLAARMKADDLNLSYVINFEMIGKTLSTGKGRVYDTGYDKSNFKTVINDIVGREFIEFLPEAASYSLFRRSDNYPFYTEFNIPAHTLSTFDFKNYLYYHRLRDEVSQLDIDNMNVVIRTSAEAILKLVNSDIKLELTESEE
ncbi:MAG: M28 family peptidase [Bacteroidota bacterium]